MVWLWMKPIELFSLGMLMISRSLSWPFSTLSIMNLSSRFIFSSRDLSSSIKSSFLSKSSIFWSFSASSFCLDSSSRFWKDSVSWINWFWKDLQLPQFLACRFPSLSKQALSASISSQFEGLSFFSRLFELVLLILYSTFDNSRTISSALCYYLERLLCCKQLFWLDHHPWRGCAHFDSFDW